MKLPPYSIFPTIIGEKISLRPLTSEDLKDLIEISFYNAIQAKTEPEAKEMQDQINQDYLNGNSIHWGISNNLTNKIVGTCGYYRGFDNQAGELGCVLLPQHQGKGFMTSAMLLAINYGLKTMKLNRIWAITNSQNKSAVKLLERLNFILVANLEQNEVEYELK